MSREFPEGRFMSSVKVGPKGQIVIPKEVREMFDISPDSMLVLLADRERGIYINRFEAISEPFVQAIDKARFREHLGEIKEEIEGK